MEAKFKQAIDEARKANPGVILPAEDIYNAIYKAGQREVVEWLGNNLEPTVPMTLDYRKWHTQLKKWGINV